jgi:hypothetical protein
MSLSALEQPTAVPMCPRHLERQAVRTCGRCGQFVCGECMAEGETCTACRTQALAGLPSSRGRATWARRFLYANIGGEVVSIFALVVSLGSSVEAPSELGAMVSGLGGLITVIAYIGAIIAFLRWEHLAMRQGIALGANPGVTPGWAVGWWFVPIMNLVRPYRALRGLLVGLAGPSADRDAKLGAWWALWVISNVLGNLDTRLSLAGHDAEVVSLASSAASIGAAILATGVVKHVQTAIEARRGEA